ncbi:carboxymuconolactone decarboxylase family protein [Thioalkalivibrio sp. ALE19]|uniref:carboxymuconolactone decarboxylase family protein n=1 Tax=Thioalkalivibrio sp. ALE19 TaxID=1266909 RepID=UPI0004219540|nr:carboxymuconolactone decarboxylase family protein [Thioalkalivibrio sp. ALE19]
MYKDWQHTAEELPRLFEQLKEGTPEVAKQFAGLARAASSDGALKHRHKELIALAIGIAVRCEGCIALHARAAVRAGASREEILETVGMATYMGGGPAFGYGAQAVEAFDQFSQ